MSKITQGQVVINLNRYLQDALDQGHKLVLLVSEKFGTVTLRIKEAQDG